MNAKAVLEAALEYAEAKKQFDAAVYGGITTHTYESRRDEAVAVFDKELERYVGTVVEAMWKTMASR